MTKPVVNMKGRTVEESVIRDFKARLRGNLLRPGDDGYEVARKVWNGMIDRRPALIVRCAGAADVVSSVNFARDNDVLVSLRGGDHSPAGNAVCDGGLMIDLSPMNGVRVDPVRRTARAGGGAKWRDFDHETQAFGLATTGGTNSDTGIGGLTLGGGMGWLAGKYGLTCDNLLSVDIVTADGRLLTASKTENPDLFWGVRGGSGNFGVVTSFEFQLHPVGPVVLGGLAIYPFEKARDALRFYSDFSSNIPDELNTVGALITSPEGRPVVGIAVCYDGPVEQGEKVLRKVREFGPPVADRIGLIPYTALQTMLDDAFPRGRQYFAKACLMKDIGDDAIDTTINYFAKVPSPYTFVGFQQLGNGANRIDPKETAFSHRDARYDFVLISGWTDPSESERNIKWTRDLYHAVQPFAHGGIYVNGLTDDVDQRIRAAYRAETYETLITLKNKYDPTNLFRLNPNINPTV